MAKGHTGLALVLENPGMSDAEGYSDDYDKAADPDLISPLA